MRVIVRIRGVAETIGLRNDGLRFARRWLRTIRLHNDGLHVDRRWLGTVSLMVFQGIGYFVIRVQGVTTCGVRMSI